MGEKPRPKEEDTGFVHPGMHPETLADIDRDNRAYEEELAEKRRELEQSNLEKAKTIINGLSKKATKEEILKALEEGL